MLKLDFCSRGQCLSKRVSTCCTLPGLSLHEQKSANVAVNESPNLHVSWCQQDDESFWCTLWCFVAAPLTSRAKRTQKSLGLDPSMNCHCYCLSSAVPASSGLHLLVLHTNDGVDDSEWTAVLPVCKWSVFCEGWNRRVVQDRPASQWERSLCTRRLDAFSPMDTRQSRSTTWRRVKELVKRSVIGSDNFFLNLAV